LEIAGFAYAPPSVGVAFSVQLCTLNAGQMILAAWLWVDLPSDSGSSGTFAVTGDTSGVFSLSASPSSDLFGGSNPNVVSFLPQSKPQVASVNETVTLTWTPGGSPGATSPKIRIRLVTEQVF
jgi:hypothetical protein